MPDVEIKPQRYRDERPENEPIGPLILAPNHASFMDHFFTELERLGHRGALRAAGRHAIA